MGGGSPELERPSESVGQKRYTLLVVPEEGGGAVTQVTVSLRQLRRWVSVLGVLIFGLLAVSVLWGERTEQMALEGLVEENLILKGRLRAIEASLDEVDVELERLRLYEAQLQGLPDDAIPGVGPLGADVAVLLGLDPAGLAGRDLRAGEEGDPMHEPVGGEGELQRSLELEERTRATLARLQLTEARLGIVAENAEAWRTRRAAMPTLLPVKGAALNSGFGYRRAPFTNRWKFHSGIDLQADVGTPVMSSGPGTVLRAEWNSGYGRMLEIDHGYGITTRYAHNSRLFVRPGDVVARGQIIATVGMTGRTTGPHLHYEVRVDGAPVDPIEFLE